MGLRGKMKRTSIRSMMLTWMDVSPEDVFTAPDGFDQNEREDLLYCNAFWTILQRQGTFILEYKSRNSS